MSDEVRRALYLMFPQRWFRKALILQAFLAAAGRAWS
jgi:hypothetical protein